MLRMFFQLLLVLCEDFRMSVDPALVDNITSKLLKDDVGFVKELLSNSIDAISKITAESGDGNFDKGRDILISVSKEDKTFVIEDRGIGLSRQDLLDYMGTIGGSHSRTAGKGIIGQFGIGFYSVFVVSSEATVVTKKYGQNQAYKFVIKKGSVDYTIEEVEKEEVGTIVTLKLLDEFAEKATPEVIEKWIKENLLRSTRNYEIKILAKRKIEKKSEDQETEKKPEDKEAEKKPEDQETEKKPEDKEAEEKPEDKEAEFETYYKTLELFPWVEKGSEEEFKKVYEELKENGHYHHCEKVRFSFIQKTSLGGRNQVDLEGLVYIPIYLDLRAIGVEITGKKVLFVSGGKVNDPNFLNVPDFLKPMTIVLKSETAELISTREELLDSKESVKKLYAALIRKIADIFAKLSADGEKDSQKLMGCYESYIKASYLGARKDLNDDLAKLYTHIMPFETTQGMRTLKEFSKLNTAEKCYYTRTSNDLEGTGVPHPLFDGIEAPYIYMDNTMDEQCIITMVKYDGKDFADVSTIEPNFQENEDPEFIKFSKEVLGDFVMDVKVSKRLKTAPFVVRQSKETISQSVRKLMGIKHLKRTPIAGMFENKLILEVNTASEEVKALKDLIAVERRKAENVLLQYFLAACTICDIQPENISKAYVALLNVGRIFTGLKELEYKEKEGAAKKDEAEAVNVEEPMNETEDKTKDEEVAEKVIEDLKEEKSREDL